MEKEYIDNIIQLLNKCHSLVLLDFILKLLQREVPQNN